MLLLSQSKQALHAKYGASLGNSQSLDLVYYVAVICHGVIVPVMNLFQIPVLIWTNTCAVVTWSYGSNTSTDKHSGGNTSNKVINNFRPLMDFVTKSKRNVTNLSTSHGCLHVTILLQPFNGNGCPCPRFGQLSSSSRGLTARCWDWSVIGSICETAHQLLPTGQFPFQW